MPEVHHRYIGLDGMRGIAAIAVMLNHVSMHSGTMLFESATLAVDLFFCLSGFVIAHAYQEKIEGGLGLTNFLRLRIIRLYPGYLIGFVLGAIALLLINASGKATLHSQSLAIALLLNLVCLPFPLGQDLSTFGVTLSATLFPANAPSWSLFLEYLVNIVFYMNVVYLRLRPSIVTIVMLAAFAGTTLYVGEAPGWNTHNFIGGLPRVGFCFFAGVSLYRHRALLSKLPEVPAWSIMLTLALLFAAPTFPFHTLFWFLTTVVLIPLLVSFGARCALSEAHSRWMAYCGALSYPLYCIHFPLLMVASLFWPEAAWRFPVLAAVVAISLLGAHGIARYSEQRLSRFLTRILPN